jgi:hypothetical protein
MRVFEYILVYAADVRSYRLPAGWRTGSGNRTPKQEILRATGLVLRECDIAAWRGREFIRERIGVTVGKTENVTVSKRCRSYRRDGANG